MSESSLHTDGPKPENQDKLASVDEASLTTPSATASPEAETAALLDTLRRGLVSDADEPARDAARAACRRLALALDLPPGALVAGAMPATPTTSPVAAIVDTLRKLPPDKLLDLAIQRLRAALPAGAPVVAPEPVRFQLVPVMPAAQRR